MMLMQSNQLSYLLRRVCELELVLHAPCDTNTYGLPNTATFIAFAKFSHCKDGSAPRSADNKKDSDIRHSLSFCTCNFRLGPIQHFLELGDAMAHTRLHIRF
jgi:hypothetical protein